MKNLFTDIDEKIAEAIIEILDAAKKPMTENQLLKEVTRRLGNGNMADEDILETLGTLIERGKVVIDKQNKLSAKK